MFVVFPNSGQVRPRGIYPLRSSKTGLLAAAAVAVLTSAAAPAQAWQAASSAEARAAINIPAQDLGGDVLVDHFDQVEAAIDGLIAGLRARRAI